MTAGSDRDTAVTPDNFTQSFVKGAKRLLLSVVAIAVLLVLLWQYRTDLSQTSFPDAALNYDGTVTGTWLGATTILFDDGQTQILIDSFFTRPSLTDILLRRPVASDAASVNDALYQNDITRLAAIVTTHTHFDHALDLGAVANRTDAIVLGSPSAARIARGAGVPEPQISIVTGTATRQFGNFEIQLVPTEHSPFGWRGRVPLAGSIETPLETPARVTEFKAGISFSVVVRHPEGTAIVQSSSGLTRGALDNVSADVVFLGTAMLSGFGRSYAQSYWNELVTSTGVRRVFPVHFEDYTRSPVQPEAMPKVLDNFARTENWLTQFQRFWDANTTIEIPVYGTAIPLYGSIVDTST